MKIKLTYILIPLILFVNSACQNQIAVSKRSDDLPSNNDTYVSEIATPPPSPKSDEEESLDIDEIVSEADSLEYEGYKVRQFLTKKKYDDDAPIADIADAVLEKGGKKVLSFEGSYYPLGNQIQFGLYSLLQKEKKQMVIYENSHKYGRIWVVGFGNEPKILFDSGDWDGFREWVSFTDFDNDGNYEIILAKYADCGFDSLATIETPLMSIIFKYDEKSGKFISANHKFQEQAKNIIQEEIKRIQQSDKEFNFRNVMEIFLEFIYAGMEKEAWKFFDENYTNINGIQNSNFNGTVKNGNSLEVKEKARKTIENFLSKDSIYLFVKKDLPKK